MSVFPAHAEGVVNVGNVPTSQCSPLHISTARSVSHTHSRPISMKPAHAACVLNVGNVPAVQCSPLLTNTGHSVTLTHLEPPSINAKCVLCAKNPSVDTKCGLCAESVRPQANTVCYAPHTHSDQSPDTILPLALSIKAWEMILGVSDWVMNTIK